MLTSFTTDRLRLRAWEESDVDTIFAIHSRWEVVRYLGSAPKAMTDRSEAVAALDRWTHLCTDGLGVWAIVPQGTSTPVGSLLLKELPLSDGGRPSGDIEIGWHLHPDAWGHGYATEAAVRVLAHAWTLGLPEVFAVTYPQNTASQSVCLRLGMTSLGLTERYYDVSTALFRIARSR